MTPSRSDLASDIERASAGPPALELVDVAVRLGETVVLESVDLRVCRDQRWVVLGPNGSGKSTLLRVASLWLHPSRGAVSVLGERLGSTDVRRLRTRVGFTSASLVDMLRPGLPALDVVMAGREAALETWWHSYDAGDRARALELLERFGAGYAADRPFGALSSGERQRVMLARSLWHDPGLVLYDEPAAGLDLGGREDLVTRLGEFATDADAPPIVLVTHHLEEVPAGFTHALVLVGGKVLASGPLEEVLTETTLSSAFGVSLQVDRRAGRWAARAG